MSSPLASRLLTATLALAALAGCPSREVAAVDPRPAPQVSAQIDLNPLRDVDILFVIDNSGSMEDEQQSLVANFDRFIDRLASIQGGLPNVHIGVVSSNVGTGGFATGQCGGDGDDGLLQNTARSACAPPAGRFIEDVADPDTGTRHRNYSGTLADSFACIARLGINGCGFEQHMESMKRALDGSRPENAGFLRPNAFLAVVFIADEDDCSAHNSALFDDDRLLDTNDSLLGPTAFRCTEWGVVCDGGNLARADRTYTDCAPRADSPYLHDPSVYADFLRSLKPGAPGKILLASIAGPLSPFHIATGEGGKWKLKPSCGTDGAGGDGAVPPVRFKALLDEFTGSVSTSICDADLSSALDTIAEALGTRLRPQCLSDEVDTTDLFPDRPGLQPECAVTQQLGSREEVLPRCAMADESTPAAGHTRACWYVAPDPEGCAGIGEALAIRVAYPDGGEAPTEAVLKVSCAGR